MSETRERPPTEANRVERARNRRPAIGAVIAVVVILIAVGVFLATRGKGPLAGVVPGTKKSPELPTPDFQFRGAKAVAIPSAAGQSAKKLKGPAEQAARQTTGVIHQLYTSAFLDPANWQNGSYDSMYQVFSSSAAGQAKADAGVLTAGPRAGDTFVNIQPVTAKIQSKVLMDAHGNPFTIVATTTFTAKGIPANGPTTLFVSRGRFFLERLNGSWKVVAFDVSRGDKVLKEQATPSARATPSGSSS